MESGRASWSERRRAGDWMRWIVSMLHRITRRGTPMAASQTSVPRSEEQTECPELSHAKQRVAQLEEKVLQRRSPWPTSTEAIAGRRLS